MWVLARAHFMRATTCNGAPRNWESPTLLAMRKEAALTVSGNTASTHSSHADFFAEPRRARAVFCFVVVAASGCCHDDAIAPHARWRLWSLLLPGDEMARLLPATAVAAHSRRFTTGFLPHRKSPTDPLCRNSNVRALRSPDGFLFNWSPTFQCILYNRCLNVVEINRFGTTTNTTQTHITQLTSGF